MYVVASLFVCVFNILSQLEGALTANGICTQEEASLVFLNAQQILTVQKQFLHDLDERLEATSDDECWNCSVGDVFQQLVRELSCRFSSPPSLRFGRVCS